MNRKNIYIYIYIFHNNFFKKMKILHFIHNNILTNFFFKELTKYKNDYQ